MLVAFDWETTSDQPKHCRGVQFAALHAVEGEWFNTICDPETGIAPGAQKTHGISREMTLGKPADHVIAKQFLNRLSGETVVGHNIVSFDIPITERLAGRAIPAKVLDTMILAYRLWPNAPSHRLSASEGEARTPGAVGLVQWLGLKQETAHDALGDCRMVLEVLARQSKDSGMTYEQMAAWQAEPQVLEVCPFGKYKGWDWKDVPRNYAQWMANNWDSPSEDMKATLFHHFGLRFKG